MIYQAISLLCQHEPEGGYYGCFSGGKDSIVIKYLARVAKVNVMWVYNQTTIDPPELVRFIKQHHPDVLWRKPNHGNFFHRMEEKAHIPTRRARWCCDEYKEARTPLGSTLIMGIRAEESANRKKKWRSVDIHDRTGRNVVLPILHWDSEYLWSFIHRYDIPYCSLYDEGFHRLGCVGCPQASKAARKREFNRWPKYEWRWKLSFQRVWDKRAGTLQKNGREWFGSACFKDWEEMWDWWNLNLHFPGEEEWEESEINYLSCVICDRQISKSRYKRVGRICRLCGGRVKNIGPCHLGGGWFIQEEGKENAKKPRRAILEQGEERPWLLGVAGWEG